METDIGTPYDYDPTTELNNDPPESMEKDEDKTSSPVGEYYHPMYMHPPPPPPPPPQYEKVEFFSTIDKSTWIVAFAVFLLGFFMGKTMTPIILKST